jgi:hypothetical protein
MTTFEAVTSYIKRELLGVAVEDAELDVQEQQQETIYSLTEMGQQQQDIFDYNELGQTIKLASEGALTQKTVATYQRYILFLIQNEVH